MADSDPHNNYSHRRRRRIRRTSAHSRSTSRVNHSPSESGTAARQADGAGYPPHPASVQNPEVPLQGPTNGHGQGTSRSLPGRDDGLTGPVIHAKIYSTECTGGGGGRPLHLACWVRGRELSSRLANGSTHNFIDLQVADSLQLPRTLSPPTRVSDVMGSALECVARVPSLQFYVNGLEFCADFLIIPIKFTNTDMILGASWFRTLERGSINVGNERISLIYNGLPVVLHCN